MPFFKLVQKQRRPMKIPATHLSEPTWFLENPQHSCSYQATLLILVSLKNLFLFEGTLTRNWNFPPWRVGTSLSCVFSVSGISSSLPWKLWHSFVPVSDRKTEYFRVFATSVLAWQFPEAKNSKYFPSSTCRKRHKVVKKKWKRKKKTQLNLLS